MQNTYDKYKSVRDTAWKFLIKNQITIFPIDIPEYYKKCNYLLLADTSISFYASTIHYKNTFATLYNPDCTPEQLRFTLAHELGHILLGHVSNKDPDEYQETAANIFASRILMPLIVIDVEHLDTTQKVSLFFGVSNEAAEIRLKRYNEVAPRKMFGVSLLEKNYIDLYQSQKNI